MCTFVSTIKFLSSMLPGGLCTEDFENTGRRQHWTTQDGYDCVASLVGKLNVPKKKKKKKNYTDVGTDLKLLLLRLLAGLFVVADVSEKPDALLGSDVAIGGSKITNIKKYSLILETY